MKGAGMTETPDTAPADPGVLYRTIWRWHFYAGLLCLPFLILLATTGALYLFRDELGPLLEKDRLVVVPTAARTVAAETLVARARAVQPGEAIRYTPPPGPGRSAEVGIRGTDGRTVSVFLDPATGRVLDRIAEDDRPMKLISRIHSLAVLGPIPNLIIEVVAGWAILLVLSGVFLWWPRGRREGVVTLRATPARRVWWRDLHAVTGAFACTVVLFLAVTGMPWSGFWGKNFREMVNASGLGMPAMVATVPGNAHAAMGHTAAGSWTMDVAAAPETGHAQARRPIADMVAIAQRERLPAGYVVRLPTAAGGPYVLQSYPAKATGQRVITVDPASGAVLSDVGFKDYGPVSKGVEWGIAVHTGGQYGLVNKLVMLAGCLSIMALSLSAAVMWWRRRPRGRLGAPPAPPRRALVSAFAVAALAIGVVFPLLGLSIVVAFAVDRLVPGALKLKHAL